MKKSPYMVGGPDNSQVYSQVADNGREYVGNFTMYASFQRNFSPNFINYA